MNALIVHYADGTQARYEDVRADEVDRDFYLATSIYEATHVTFTHGGRRRETGAAWGDAVGSGGE